jgi:hypothetical protein
VATDSDVETFCALQLAPVALLLDLDNKMMQPHEDESAEKRP